MLDEQNPVEQIPLERVDKWGCPWHGLITDGALLGTVPMLPSGSHARAVDAPPGTLEDWDGSAWVVARPDMPIPSTEAEEAALGMEWRNYALLSGRYSNLYGKNLAPVAYAEAGVFHWLALDDLGAWWHCVLNVPNPWTQSGGLSVEISMETFGAFDLPGGTQHFDAVHLADVGQATPALPVGGSFPTDITTGQVWVSDVLPTGTQLILGMRNSVVDKESSPTFMQDEWDSHYHARFRQSLGFLLLDMQFSGGVADPVLTVIADRETTLGTITSGASGSADLVPGTIECLDCNTGLRVPYQTLWSWTSTNNQAGWGQIDGRIVSMWFAGNPLLPTPVFMTNRVEYTCDNSGSMAYSRCADTTVFDASYGGTSNNHITLSFATDSVDSDTDSALSGTTHAEGSGPDVSESSTVTATQTGMPDYSHSESFSGTLPGYFDGLWKPAGCDPEPTQSTPGSVPAGFDSPGNLARFGALHGLFSGGYCGGVAGYPRRVVFLSPTLLTVIVDPIDVGDGLIDGAYSPQIGSGGPNGTTGRIAQTSPGSGIPKKVYGSHNPPKNETSVAVDSRIGYV